MRLPYWLLRDISLMSPDIVVSGSVIQAGYITKHIAFPRFVTGSKRRTKHNIVARQGYIQGDFRISRAAIKSKHEDNTLLKWSF
jgi:hypothetical protein